MKKSIFLSFMIFFFLFAEDEKTDLEKFTQKRLIEGVAKNPLSKDYSAEQLTKFRKQFKILLTNAKNGDTRAMVILGNFYYQGTGHKILKQDLSKATKWYQKASNLGSPEGMYNLGNCYRYGAGVKQDNKKAEELFASAVDNGLNEVSFKVAEIFENDKNFKVARKYYLIAANSVGDTKSMKKAAEYYMYGIGGEKNEKDAFNYYSATAFNGDADSQYVLAKIYKDGIFVEKDLAESISWLELSANNGNIEAQFNLGFFYLRGTGKYKKDRNIAIIWLRKAAKQGSIDAQLTLGDIYDGVDGGEADVEEAYKWYRLVAFRDIPQAMLKLGLFLELGRGTKQNTKEALQWYEKSVSKNYAPAFLRLGQVYEQGIIIKQDIQRALTLYKKAIDLELGEASIYLAKIYKEGIIVKKDDAKAFSLLKSAAVKGYEPALEVLKNYN